jgi:hypothetical protein
MLNKLDIKALRECGKLSFHHVERESYILATKEPSRREKETNPFAQDNDRKILCHANGYLHSFRAVETMFPESNEWQTIAGLLREGDEISLIWGVDYGRNQYMEKALPEPLHGDQLKLRITRGEKVLQFLISQQCCPDNSARMIKMEETYER